MKIMIVSDDAILVKGFYRLFPWKDMGMEVIADAKNELSLFEKLEEMKEHSCDFPNVIILDMMKPVVDSPELVNRLDILYPGLFVILVSDEKEREEQMLSAVSGENIHLIERRTSPDILKECLIRREEKYRREREEQKKETKAEPGALKKSKLNHTLKQVIDYINLHFEEKEVTLAFLANKFFIQKNYLCALFKQEMKITVTDYIVELRMKKAKNLMRTTGLSITEIAERVSYTDLSYFNRLFRKENGVGPREYMNQMRKK